MAKIEKFEDLICWRKANELVKEIYELTYVSKFSKDYALKDQIRRAAISIPLNIAEGFGRRTHKEFKNFLFILMVLFQNFRHIYTLQEIWHILMLKHLIIFIIFV